MISLAPSTTTTGNSNARWELRLDYEARTSFLGREHGKHNYSLNPQVRYWVASGIYGRIEGPFFNHVRPACTPAWNLNILMSLLIVGATC